MLNNKGFSNILVISIILALLSVGGYFGYMYTKKSPAPIKNEPTMVTQPQPVAVKPIPTSTPTKQELFDSISKDLNLNKKDDLDLSEDTYIRTEKYEVVLAGYQYAHHILARPLSGGKWKDEFGTQQAYSCEVFDRLGVTRAKTIELRCFDYGKGIFRDPSRN